MSGSLLVVDDDRAHLAMLRTILGGWGYRVTGVEDGGEAIAAVRDAPFDGVLMDVRMARVGGRSRPTTPPSR
jgi:two-component system response regulator HydG